MFVPLLVGSSWPASTLVVCYFVGTAGGSSMRVPGLWVLNPTNNTEDWGRQTKMSGRTYYSSLYGEAFLANTRSLFNAGHCSPREETRCLILPMIWVQSLQMQTAFARLWPSGSRREQRQTASWYQLSKRKERNGMRFLGFSRRPSRVCSLSTSHHHAMLPGSQDPHPACPRGQTHCVS